MSGARVLMLSTADWSAPLWTNKQYMACELAREFDVVYVESLGLRRPELSWRDLERIASRARRMVRPTEPGDATTPRPRPARLEVRSPRVIPYHRGAVARLNRWSLNRLAADWSEVSGRVLWTYSPVTYGLERGARTVYHCVDLLGAQPGFDPDLIDRAERELARSGALGIASSREVAVHLRAQGFDRVVEWPNVADVDVFVDAARQGQPREARTVVFGGNITEHKVDTDVLEAVLDRVPDVRVVLAGPIAEGGGGEWEGLRRLRSRGAELVGRRSLTELADLYATASVAVIPYRLNDYTRGVLPLKVPEYLAAGLPVVATALPSLDPVDGDVVIAHDADEFVALVGRMIERGVDDVDVGRRRSLAEARSWGVRGAEARALVASLLEQP